MLRTVSEPNTLLFQLAPNRALQKPAHASVLAGLLACHPVYFLAKQKKSQLSSLQGSCTLFYYSSSRQAAIMFFSKTFICVFLLLSGFAFAQAGRGVRGGVSSRSAVERSLMRKGAKGIKDDGLKTNETAKSSSGMMMKMQCNGTMDLMVELDEDMTTMPPGNYTTGTSRSGKSSKMNSTSRSGKIGKMKGDNSTSRSRSRSRSMGKLKGPKMPCN
ncbi:expressed unknown protein [Seminavis robusta]|uniref:Uncharacterized protein n=1 Tax=Seminavis robusta TaxID=568900 RepID=A0A9N8EBW8_9STRA|nr:expressed unknown protein [Seminavis robusta]|eukprot:Sro858_g211870.1 n/a (216) ;mRNA; f:27392-28741